MLEMLAEELYQEKLVGELCDVDVMFVVKKRMEEANLSDTQTFEVGWDAASYY